MKKILSTILALTLLVGMCTTAATAESKTVTLQFWGAIPPENGPAELVDNWNASHPEIQVEYTRFVNDDAGNMKLETALIGGEVDVFINYLPPSLEKRVENDMLYPIDEFLQRDNIDVETAFGPSNWLRNGKHYFLTTYGGSNSYILYNKDMLDAANITIPENWTWDEFEAISKQLTTGEGIDKVFGSSMGGTYATDDWALAAMYKYGGDYYYRSETESNFEDPLFLDGLARRYRMEVVDQTMINRMDVKITKMDIAAEYCAGKIAMLLANYHLRDVKNLEKYPHTFVTSFAPVPQNPGTEKVISGGLREWIAISPKCQNKDEAWEFLKYYAMDGYYPMCKSGRFPAWKGADAAKVTDLVLGENKQVFDLEAFEKYVVNYAKHQDSVSTITIAKPVISQLMGEAFESVTLGEKTPEEALATLKVEADKAIAQGK